MADNRNPADDCSSSNETTNAHAESSERQQQQQETPSQPSTDLPPVSSNELNASPPIQQTVADPSPPNAQPLPLSLSPDPAAPTPPSPDASISSAADAPPPSASASQLSTVIPPHLEQEFRQAALAALAALQAEELRAAEQANVGGGHTVEPFPALPPPPQTPYAPPAAPQGGGSAALRVSAEELEMMELKVKVICQEKYILALKMELKAAELQVSTNAQVNAKKTRLIELLDNKMAAVERRNVKLLELMEQTLKEKDGNSSRLKEAAHNMQDLTTRLVDSERMKVELVKMNTELKRMLESVETRGTQIAKLAKEKVLKYREESGLMQQEISDLKDAASISAAGGSAGATGGALPSSGATVEAGAVGGSIEAPGGAVAPTDDLWTSMSEQLTRITAALHALPPPPPNTDPALAHALSEITEASEALGAVVERAQHAWAGLSADNTRLRAALEEGEAGRRRAETALRAELNEVRGQLGAKDTEIEELKAEVVRVKGAIAVLIGSK